MKTNSNRVLTIIISSLPLIVWSVVVIPAKIAFEQNCSSYLKTASNANTVPLALAQLTKAVNYLEREHLTTGYTSVCFKTEDENIAFFYQNLKAAKNELEVLSKKEDLTALEQSNALLKLRDTLTDHEEGRETVTAPDGIFIYPHNKFNVLWGTISLVFVALGWLVVVASSKD